MVDFNAKETVGTPAINVVKIQWLQARYNLIQAWEHYYKLKLKGATPTLADVRACLISLFIEMQSYLERSMPKERLKEGYSFDSLSNIIYEEDLTEDQIKQIIKFLNNKLDKIQLIKIDTRQAYDRFDLEAENKAMGLD